MATIDKIRNELIDKILSIRNKDFLEALINWSPPVHLNRMLWN